MRTITTSICLLLSVAGLAQAPAILWQNTMGGTQSDYAITVEPTASGGYIVGGISESESGFDKAENNHGSYFKQDYWVVHLDSLGTITWENTIGGNKQDFFEGLTVATDNSYFVFGESMSTTSFDKSEDGCLGTDIWIVNVDTSGDVVWDKCIGGSNYDYLRAACKVDGGYILAGNSASNISCQKTSNHYGYWYPHDWWILRTDEEANIIWQTRIGGDSTESMRSVYPTADGGCILTGYTYSTATYEISEPNFGYADIWVVKLDGEGNLQWEQRLGGNGGDYPNAAIELADGSFIILGESGSNPSPDKAEDLLGGYDIWLIKLDPAGNIVWENVIGTSTEDLGLAMTKTWDGNFVIAGNSNSAVVEIDKTEPGYGGSDMWILKIDPDGNIIWQKVIGGSGDDYPYSINETHDFGLVIAGSSDSPVSGVKTEGNIGSDDYWVIKLAPDCAVMEYYADADGDGFGDAETTMLGCAVPEGYVADDSDCNDADGAIFPAAPEVCNYIDDDCNGLADDGITYPIYFADADTDGYGDAAIDSAACTTPFGYITDATDCNDLDALIHPDASEVCNYLDDNCNALIDEDVIYTLYYADADGDGYGDAAIDTSACLAPAGYILDNTDCNDDNAAIFPLAAETCNGLDDDCDAVPDEDLPLNVFYADMDGDLYGTELLDSITCYTELAGFVPDNADCNDADPEINPGAVEICNNLDDNCSGVKDEDLPVFLQFRDADDDGFGTYLDDSVYCEMLPGFVLDNTDCDDDNASVYPGAPEVIDGLDNDCNGDEDDVIATYDIVATTVSVYPNPVKDLLIITSNTDMPVSVTVYTVQGQIMHNLICRKQSELHVRDWPSGIYIVKGAIGSDVFAVPFIKE